MRLAELLHQARQQTQGLQVQHHSLVQTVQIVQTIQVAEEVITNVLR